MSDDANVQGVPVWRGYASDKSEAWYLCTARQPTASHVAHSLSDEAQVARQESCMREIRRTMSSHPWDVMDAVLRVLGLST